MLDVNREEFKNYETWLIHLHLTTDLQVEVYNLIEKVSYEEEHKLLISGEEPTERLAELLQMEIEENLATGQDERGELLNCLLQTALAEVDWQALAELFYENY